MTPDELAAPLEPRQLAAYFALMEVSGRLRHAVELQLRRDGDLSYVQFQILATLSDLAGSDPRMTEIADRLVLSRSALTYQAVRLEAAGLLARSAASDDERSTTLALTPAGAERVRAVLPGHVALVREQLLDVVGARDLAAMTRILERVRDRMRERPPRSADHTPRPRSRE